MYICDILYVQKGVFVYDQAGGGIFRNGKRKTS